MVSHGFLTRFPNVSRFFSREWYPIESKILSFFGGIVFYILHKGI